MNRLGPCHRATREPSTCLACGAAVELVQLGAAVALVDPDGSDRAGALHRCPEHARIEWFRSEAMRRAARAARLARENPGKLC